MENYVVRIYRRCSDNPENIAGVVEKPDKGENKTFNSKEEFDEIFWPSEPGGNTPKLKRTLEFRKYRRFLLKRGTLVFETTTDVGKIIDISMGGLSFACPDISIDSKEPLKAGIIFDNNQHNTEKIKCRFVKKTGQSSSLDRSGQDSIDRYSIKFEDLTPYQTSQLRYIIQHCTFGEV